MPLHAQQVGEHQLGVDELAAVVAVAKALVDVDHLTLQLLGVLVAALFLQDIDEEPKRRGCIGVIFADLAQAAEQGAAYVGFALAGTAEFDLGTPFQRELVVGLTFVVLGRRCARPLRKVPDCRAEKLRGLAIARLGVGITAARFGNARGSFLDGRGEACGIDAVTRPCLGLGEQGTTTRLKILGARNVAALQAGTEHRQVKPKQPAASGLRERIDLPIDDLDRGFGLAILAQSPIEELLITADHILVVSALRGLDGEPRVGDRVGQTREGSACLGALVVEIGEIGWLEAGRRLRFRLRDQLGNPIGIGLLLVQNLGHVGGATWRRHEGDVLGADRFEIGGWLHGRDRGVALCVPTGRRHHLGHTGLHRRPRGGAAAFDVLRWRTTTGLHPGSHAGLHKWSAGTLATALGRLINGEL